MKDFISDEEMAIKLAKAGSKQVPDFISDEEMALKIGSGQGKEDDIMKKILAAGSGAAKGATWGLSDPLLAGTTGLVNAGLEMDLSLDNLKEEYGKGSKQFLDAREQYPEYAIPGEIAGAIASPVGNKMAAGFKAAGLAGKAGAGAMNLGANALKGAARGALESGAYTAATNLGEKALGKDMPEGQVATSTGVGGAVGAAIPVLGKAGKFLGKKALGVATGTDSKFVDDFIERGGQLFKKDKNGVDILDPDEVALRLSDAANRGVLKGEQIENRLAGHAVRSVERLKEVVTSASNSSYNQLSKSKAQISKRNLPKLIGSLRDELTVFGQEFNVKGFGNVYKELDNLQSTVESWPALIKGTEAKQILQTLDKVTKYTDNVGQFDNPVNDVLKSLRGEINSRLRKQDPLYAKIMDEEVVPMVEKLDAFRDMFGTKDKALATIKKIGSDMKKGARPSDFRGETIIPRAEEKLTNLFNEAPPILKQKEMGVDGSLNYLMAAKHLEDFRTTGSSQEKLSGLVKAFKDGGQSSGYIKDQIGNLNKLSGEDFTRTIEDLAIRTKFDEIGTSKPSLWEAVSFIGIGGAALSSSIGLAPAVAVVGLTRVYGPLMAKRILGEVANLNGVPTVAKINKMALPDNVKRDLISQLNSFIVPVMNSQETVDIQDIGTGKEIQSSFKKIKNPIERAKKLSQLHEDKTVNYEDIHRYVFGDKPIPENSIFRQVLENSGKSQDAFPLRDVLKNNYQPPPQAKPYMETVVMAEKKYGIPSGLLLSLLQQESNFDPNARSPVGATGIAQFMEPTAKEVGLRVGGGVDERLNPIKSIDASAKYLSELYAQTGDWEKALAAYNGGIGRLRKAGGDISQMPEETRNYVPKIMDRLN